MEKVPILLFDPQLERAGDAQFLLQLATYQVALVHNDDEAFNWVISRLDSIEQPALLLVNCFAVDMPLLQLLPELRRQGAQVPVLFVARDDLTDCAAVASGVDAVYCCRPENMLSQIRGLVTDYQRPGGGKVFDRSH